MGFSLKKFLEESSAQLNPFDGGKTAQTVRQQRATTPPPQAKQKVNYSSPVSAVAGLVRKATPNTSYNNPASVAYGVIRNATPMKVRDVFDANTKLDQQKRAQATQTPYRIPTNYADEQRMRGNNRPSQNIGQQVAGNTARVLNTAGRYVTDTLPRANVAIAAKIANRTGLINNDQYARGVNRLSQGATSGYKSTGGILNAGTVFDNPQELENANFGTVAKKSLGYGAGTYGELSPVGVKGGIIPRTLLGATEGAIGDAGSQLANTGRIDAKQTVGSALLGGTIPNVAPAIGGVPKVVGKVTNAVTDKRLTDADVSALLKLKQGRGGFMNDAEYIKAQESVRKAGIDTSKPESWSQIDKIIADYNQVLEGRGDASKFNMGQSRFTPLNQGGNINPKAMIDDAKNLITPKSDTPQVVDPMQKIFDQNPMNMTRQQVSKQVKAQVANGEITPTINIKQRGKEKAIKVERIPVNIKAIDPERVKDINGLESQAQDLWRNTEKVFGKDSEIGNTILRPLDDAKGRFIDDQDNYAGQLKETIVDGLKIKKGSKESAAVQSFGEGSKTYDQLIEEFGQQKADDIVNADKWFRQAYDEILDDVNAQRMRIYNGNQEKMIPKRKDYYRHFTEMQDGFQGLLNIFETPAGISSSLAGISQNTKPKSKWLSFAQQRMGNKTDVDAVGGFLDYLRASSYAKNIDPEIARIRKFREALADQTATGKEAGKLNTYLEFLDDYANDLAGKTNPADRFVQKITGRKVMGVLNWVNKRAKSNAILGNFSSSVAQVFGVPLGLGDVQSPKAIYDGSKDYFKAITGGKTAIDNSTFIKERYSNIYDKFDEGILKNSKKFAAWMVGVGDEVATKWIWHAQHNKALQQGLSEADAVRFADGRTRAVVAGRGVGEVPLIQKSKVFQLVAPFQLEVGNQWLVFKDWHGQGAEQMIKGLVTYSVAAAIMNKGAEQIRGNGVVFDPLDALSDAWGEMTTDEVDSEGNPRSLKDKAMKAGGRLGGEVLGNIPGGAYAAQTLVPNEFKRQEIFGDKDPSRFGTSPLAISSTVGAVGDIADRPTDWRAYSKAVTGLGTPFAGKQIDRSINAVADQARGYTTSASGSAKFATEESPLRRGQAVLFGSNSTPNAREYYSQDQTPLSDKQNEKLKSTPKEDQKMYLESVKQKRLDNREKGKAKASGETSSTVEQIKQSRQDLLDKYDGQFSDDDKAILSMNKEERQRIIDSGTKTQEELDGLDRYALNKRKELGLPAGTGGQTKPKDLDKTDDKVKAFYEDRAYVHDMDYDKWKTSPADSDSGKDLIRRANQIRPEGFPELPNTNETAEMYADFKQKESTSNWSKLQANEKRKEFLRSVYKKQVTEEQKFIDDLGTDKLIDALNSGDVTSEQVSSMVELDNYLIKLGATPMLSKTIRRGLGLGDAPSSGGSGGSGSSRRSGRAGSKNVPDSVFNLMDLTSTRASNRNALRKILNSAKL